MHALEDLHAAKPLEHTACSVGVKDSSGAEVGTAGKRESGSVKPGAGALQAMEPFFSVLLSWLFLGEAASAPVLLSLLPIVGGVAAASVSEVRLSWARVRMETTARTSR